MSTRQLVNCVTPPPPIELPQVACFVFLLSHMVHAYFPISSLLCLLWFFGCSKVDSVEHCDKFWYWLQSKGINSNRSGIVNAIAEKVNTWIPGEFHNSSRLFVFVLFCFVK